MTIVSDITKILEHIAPLALAESWDNVGLLVGDPNQPIKRLMTCLTVTEQTLNEAVESQVHMLVSHHPLPFKPMTAITTSSVTGKLLLKMIRAGIALYSPHTAWDNAREGINDQLAERLQLERVQPLQPFSSGHACLPDNGPIGNQHGWGAGRVGDLAQALDIRELVEQIRQRLPGANVTLSAADDHPITRLAIVCGSGGSMVASAVRQKCDAFLTGEATYHQCLEAISHGMHLIMVGHHASERFAMSILAHRLSVALPDVDVWASHLESDPIAHHS